MVSLYKWIIHQTGGLKTELYTSTERLEWVPMSDGYYSVICDSGALHEFAPGSFLKITRVDATADGQPAVPTNMGPLITAWQWPPAESILDVARTLAANYANPMDAERYMSGALDHLPDVQQIVECVKAGVAMVLGDK